MCERNGKPPRTPNEPAMIQSATSFVRPLSLTRDDAVSRRLTAVPFNLQTRRYAELPAHLDFYESTGDLSGWWYVQRLVATADGRYDFRAANLNEAIANSEHVNVRPTSFREWLQGEWGGQGTAS